MPYQPEWIPLIEMIRHIQAKDHCDERQAAIDAQNALYDGKIQSRFRGSRDRIESNRWASAAIFRDGLVSFNWPSAGVPAPGQEPRRFLVEVFRKDVLQLCERQRSTGAAERSCLLWLVDDIKRRGVDNVSKSDRRQYAVANFDVSPRAFDDRIWPDALDKLEPELRAKASLAGRKKSTQENRRKK